jgi:hypothetical protein
VSSLAKENTLSHSIWLVGIPKIMRASSAIKGSS